MAAAEVHFELGQIDKLPRKTITKDPRIDWLVRLLKKHPEDKFLLICRYRKRAEQISEAVKQRINLPMSIFHEEQTILQRDRNAAWFSQPAPDGARLLICSEIGSEGRNFQFAQHLVLYDLPLDPELLEQRIGRLDRIGQRETIHLHTPYFKGSGGEGLFRWFHEGIDAFAHPIQGGTLYLEKFLPRLRTLLKGEAVDPKALEKLIADTVSFRKVLLKKFEQGRDRLLEWHSCRPARVRGLIEEISSLDQAPALADFLLAVFDHFGVNVEKLGLHESPGGRDHRSWLLTPGHTISDQVSGIPPEGKMITFDRTVALHRDDVDFMTWDHPLVTALLDLLLGSEVGNAAFSELKVSPGLPPGLYLETMHVLEGSCAARFDLDRFLPSTPLRHLVDARGGLCPPAFLEALDQAVPRDAVRHALRGQSAALQPLLDLWKKTTGQSAEVQSGALRREIQKKIDRDLGHELERVVALRARNGKSGGKEAEHLREERDALTRAVAESRLRLDALRLIRVA
jgi:ATP-dependent helicase HepA